MNRRAFEKRLRKNQKKWRGIMAARPKRACNIHRARRQFERMFPMAEKEFGL